MPETLVSPRMACTRNNRRPNGPVTTSVLPVVGGTGRAYQPESVFPNIGTLLEVKPTLLENGQVLINVHSTVSEANGKSVKRDHGEVQLRSMPTRSPHRFRPMSATCSSQGEWPSPIPTKKPKAYKRCSSFFE
jgi:hypothetical protein